ncbi:hypothetical protein [Micromonospora eburnea]|nr:hypothetical protein [Micromonospora eburnea]
MRRPGIDATRTRLLLASGEGFTDDLWRAAADRPDVVLVDAARLYSD